MTGPQSPQEQGLAPFADIQVGAHRLAILRDGGQTFSAMLAAIRGAERSICLETYILRDDQTGARFGQALIARARAGVEVNVLYDAWGSSVSIEYLVWLSQGGVRTMAFHPVELSPTLDKTIAKLTLRNHRKLLIVDGKVAFTGGSTSPTTTPARPTAAGAGATPTCGSRGRWWPSSSGSSSPRGRPPAAPP
jgi:cardiolipin synthase